MNLHCPNQNLPEWKLLVKKVGYVKAMEEYEKNNFDYPQYIKDAVDGTTTITTEEATEEFLSSRGLSSEDEPILKVLDDKERVLAASKVILGKKLKTLEYKLRKNPHLAESKAQLEALLKQLDRLETDAALITFIKTAQTMTTRAEDWMQKALSNKDKEITLESIRGIYDFVASFDILDNLAEDMFNDPEHKETLTIVRELTGKRESIRKDYIRLSKEFLANQFAPDFGKIRADYLRQAEVAFNTTQRPALKKRNFSNQQIQENKESYIQGFMENYAAQMEQETKDYVKGMLTQTVDVSTAAYWFVNPKDIGHDIISAIVQELDFNDFTINQKTYTVTDEADALNKKFEKFVGKNGDPKVQYESLFARDENNEIIPVLVNPDSYNWKTFQAKYKDTPVMELHAFLVRLSIEKDEAVGAHKLGYAMPKINKSSMERIYSNGVMHTIKAGTVDHFKLRAEDTEFGDIESRLKAQKDSNTINIITNEAGKEREHIPLHYRMEVEEKDLSYDIISSFLLDYNNSLQFEVKTKTAVTLEVLKDVIGDANIVQRTDFRKALKIDQSKQVSTVKGQGSNLQSAVDSILRHRVYGITIEGDPEMAKLAKGIQSYTSIIGLSANWISGGANLLQGQLMSWIEATGKNTGHYGVKNRAKATAMYWADIHNISADVGARVPKSKTNLLIRKFNAASDFSPVEKRFVENNVIKRLLDSSALLFFNNAGEHATQATVMYSILDNIKVMDADGNLLDKNYNIVTNRDEALSLADAYTVNKDGKLELDPRIAKTEKTKDVTDSSIRQLSGVIRRVNRDLYGNYDSNNKSEAQRTIVGALAFQMRGWLIPGFQKRWKGMGNAKTKSDDLRLDQRVFNAETQQFEEGTYTTAVRLLLNLRKDIKAMKLQGAPGPWEKLTDAEKANFKKAVLEIGIAVTFLLVALSFRDGEEPEDVYIAYFSRRLYSELTTFVNPQEAVRTFRNPLMVLNTVDDGMNLLWQLTDPTETYTSGTHSGEYKLEKRFMKIVPIWKQLDRDIKESLLFLER